MTTVASDLYRCERKFLLPDHSVPEAEALIRRHPALFREVYPERPVNSLYLDTPDLRHYSDHVQGATSRKKVRLRWYGPLAGYLCQPRLEFKLKQGALSRKQSYDLGPFSPESGHWLQTLPVLWNTAHLPDLVQLELRFLAPTLANRYHRRYYLSADGRFRLTLDFGLQFLRPAEAECPPLAHPAPELGMILELKYPASDEGDAEAVTQHLGLRVRRVSKYILGLDCLNGRA